MPTYYTTDHRGTTVIIRLEGDLMLSFTENPENADWCAYEEWLAEGNTPQLWPPAE